MSDVIKSVTKFGNVCVKVTGNQESEANKFTNNLAKVVSFIK